MYTTTYVIFIPNTMESNPQPSEKLFHSVISTNELKNKD